MNTTILSSNPEMILSDVDSRITKIRPMATPIDQISRLGTPRQAKSMKAEYYSVDTPATETTTIQDLGSTNYNAIISIHVSRNDIFNISDTLFIPDLAKTPVMLYVMEVDGTKLTTKVIGDGEGVAFDSLPSGSRIIRMGRAAAELDVQTTNAQALPKKLYNYCQIFKAQVEQSMLQRLSAKEVGWTLSDQEEVALIDMRMGMEKNFLFGVKERFEKGQGYGDVFLTDGIWHQTDNDFNYNPANFSAADLVKLSRRAFTGNAGSARKILVCGSGLIEALSQLTINKSVGATETVTRWGIDFTEIHTNFGRLYVVLSEVFDICGHANDGMVIDPEYLQKYTHIPFKAMPIDLSKSGQRNTEAVVLTEASCLVLRYPNAHLRIIAD